MILLYAASRDPRRGESPVMCASTVQVAALPGEVVSNTGKQSLYGAFCRLYYKLKHQSIPILEQMLTNLQTIRNRRMLWSPDIVALNKRISDLTSQNQTLAFLKQQGLVDPDIFIAKTNELTKQLRQAKQEKEKHTHIPHSGMKEGSRMVWWC